MPPRGALDAIVVGLGAHGSACLYQLAKQGCQVLGIERFGIGHANSSHHGHTRITRMAYMEGPEYVPLLRKCFELYAVLEREAKQKLYHQTGVLNIGSHVFRGAHATAVAQGLPHEVLTGAQASQRFPGLSLPPDMPVLYEAVGGILEPEKMIAAHVAVATQHGAQVVTGAQVTGWRVLPSGGVQVTTDAGGSYEANKLVLTAGPWMEQLVPELKGLCVPGRATVAWLQPHKPELYTPSNFPVFMVQEEPAAEPAPNTSGGQAAGAAATAAGQQPHDVQLLHGGTAFYGFPAFGAPGLKIGKFCVSEPTDPDQLARQQRPEDIAPLRAAVEAFMPHAAGEVLDFSACMFTMTPDGHFVIDTHPRHDQVILCSACSGHGFKLSPAIGLVLADMVRHGRCAAFEEALTLHRLDARRPGHSAVLERFARSC